ARRTVLNEMRSIENVVRAALREAGIKLGRPSRARFGARVREFADNDRLVMAIVDPLLTVLATMLEQLSRLTKQVLDLVRGDETCRLLMTMPGVGPVTSLAFRAPSTGPSASGARAMSAHISG